MRVSACLFHLWRPVFRPPETLRPLRGQPVAVLVQIHQREGRADPLVVFPDTPIAHLYESEHTLENAERMLHFGSNSSLGCVIAPGFFVHIILEPGPAASHVLRFRRGGMDGLGLALIASIAPYLALCSMQ